MATLKEAAAEFLSQERIAVSGVSRSGQSAANAIYHKLQDTGHEVFAVNPNAETFEGQPCYPDLKSIPGGVDGVVTVNRPEIVEQIVHECAELGVSRVWMHHSMHSMGTSISEPAVAYCREQGIKVIPGGCPMMFSQPVDFGHKMMRWFSGVSGNLPKEV
jgi:predicted CoA-binding protein